MSKHPAPKIVTRIANQAGADVNVVQTVSKYNPELPAAHMHCTGCGEEGPQRNGTYTSAKPAIDDAKKDAARHAHICAFQAPK